MRDDSSALRSDQPQFLSATAQSMELLDRRPAVPSRLLKAENGLAVDGTISRPLLDSLALLDSYRESGTRPGGRRITKSDPPVVPFYNQRKLTEQRVFFLMPQKK